MSFFNRTFRNVVIGGMLFVIPLTVLVLVFGKFLTLIRPLVQWVNQTFGIHRFLGLAAVSITGLVLLVLICFFAGMLIKQGLIRSWGAPVEEFLFRMFPSLQMLKYRLLSDNNNQKTNWTPILLDDEPGKRIAFITDDRNERYYSIFIPDAPRMDAGEVRIVEKKLARFKKIPMKQAINGIFHFGRGFLPVDNQNPD